MMFIYRTNSTTSPPPTIAGSPRSKSPSTAGATDRLNSAFAAEFSRFPTTSHRGQRRSHRPLKRPESVTPDDQMSPESSVLSNQPEPEIRDAPP